MKYIIVGLMLGIMLALPFVSAETYTEYSVTKQLPTKAMNAAIYSVQAFGCEPGVKRCDNSTLMPMDKLKSWAGTAYKCVVSYDGQNDVICDDFNATTRTITWKQTKEAPISETVPLRVWKEVYVIDNKTNGIKLDDKTGLPVMVKQYSTQMMYTFSALSKEKKLIIPATPDETIELGQNSTLVKISFGSNAGDGYITADSGAGGSWDSIHDAASGSQTVDWTATVAYALSRWHSNTHQYIGRSFFPINTSSLPDNVVVIEAKVALNIVGTSDTDNDGYDYIAFVANTTQASPYSLTATDFNDCGAVDAPVEASNRTDITGISTGWNYWGLTASGRQAVSLTGITYLGIREGHDISDHPISNGLYNNIYYSTYESGANKPYINVTYDTTTTTTSTTTTTTLPPVFSFSVTLPSQTAVESAPAGNATTGIEFNFSGATAANVQPCVVHGTCQGSGTPIFVVTNDGTIDFNYSIYINSAMPAMMVLKADIDNNVAGATTLTTSPGWVVRELLHTQTQNMWLWASVTNGKATDSTTRTITNAGIE